MFKVAVCWLQGEPTMNDNIQKNKPHPSMKFSHQLSPGGRVAHIATNWNRTFFFVCLLGALSAKSATYTWTGTGFNGETDHKWSNPMNWAGLAAPQNGEQGVSL